MYNQTSDQHRSAPHDDVGDEDEDERLARLADALAQPANGLRQNCAALVAHVEGDQEGEERGAVRDEVDEAHLQPQSVCCQPQARTGSDRASPLIHSVGAAILTLLLLFWLGCTTCEYSKVEECTTGIEQAQPADRLESLQKMCASRAQ